MPSALAVFACRPNSHPFQERHVYLDEPVKIGRSVARCRPAQNNATFDCKVLSRNHALVWFDHKTGKFYLQDTKSSNGTFINSQRLSRGSEESPPCEVLSGDIIQFGVDVTENTRKVTHGCIVSAIKLFLPDGNEVAANTPSMYSQELFQLSQYLQEALHREQMLEQKLATLQRLLANTQEASESSWQALIDEDRLLSRLEVMGSQLQAYSKSQTEDGIRKELLALQEDKHNYETTAKESLRRVLQEKIEVVRKLAEVERSLSNTEDECTHLKEMSERGQEELRELANKYNAAVNEIKELTDKIKAAEGRQEELTQRGAKEKRELELRIEEMEEKEQVLQARIEALQADNDFTNERLAALQDNCHVNNSGEDSTRIQHFIECEIAGRFSHSVCLCVCLLCVFSGTQIDAKESDMSDTLSPSKDRSSDDTSDGNMEDQELNEPQNRVALLKAELHRAGLEPGDTEQVIHHLHRELLEAQEMANTGKQRCLELQALLEEERRSNCQQTEDSTKQIQYLQSQLGKLQADMEALREQRESTICTTREELYSAQEEILVLRHAMEAATVEREQDIAALQADLGSVRSELEHWRSTAAKYGEEIGRLQEAFRQQQQHQNTATQLQGEPGPHSSSQASECPLQPRTKEHSQVLSSNLVSLEKREEVLQDKLGSLENQHVQDASRLRTQLDQAQAHTHTLQKEYEDTQSQLLALRQRYERTEKEKLSIHQQLEQCKSSLKLLQDKTGSVSAHTLL
uniref:Sarcolemmal membrane-associated protein n=1 Tax=Takifugu rubripes TaxID=31033 RepID=A0A674P5D4_TAKRU